MFLNFHTVANNLEIISPKTIIVLIKEMDVITLNNVVLYGFQIICLMISHLMTKQYFLMGKPLSTIYNSNTNVSREIFFS